MSNQIFAIRDVKVSSYHTPFFTQNEIMAVRNLTAYLTNENSIISQFPEDYELFHLGSFDEITAKFTMFDNPKFVINAMSVVQNIQKSKMLQQKLMAAALQDKKEEKSA